MYQSIITVRSIVFIRTVLFASSSSEEWFALFLISLLSLITKHTYIL